MERGELMLRADKIGVRIGNARILFEVSLSIEPGKVVALLGPNGAGKSTLFKALSGELVPTTGSITMDGAPVGPETRRAHALRRSVMPQASSLTFPFTALDVALMGRIPHMKRGIETENDLRIALDAMEMTGTAHLCDRRYPTLSGGEGRRVHLARSIAQIWEKPSEGNRYLLLDEPTAGLDPAHQHATLGIARRLADSGVGVATVLHDLNLAAEYADTIVLLRNGRIAAEGDPESVLTAEVIRDVYCVGATVGRHPHKNCPLVVTGTPETISGAERRAPLAVPDRTSQHYRTEQLWKA